MKIATKNICVYNSTGEHQIGSLLPGDTAQKIEENPLGLQIAYIIGLIKTEDMKSLVCPEEWERSANSKQNFLRYLADQVGSLYVWGAQGQQMTPLLINKLEKKGKEYDRATAHYNDHVRTGQRLIAYDCSGLIVKFLLSEGLISSDRSANGLYHNECDAISENDLTGGDLVFKKYFAKNQMYHVGVYMGDGSVVHAKGRDDGVVREPLSAAGWNRYGRLKCWGGLQKNVDYHRLLKNIGKPFMIGDDVRRIQMRLECKGYLVGSIDGSYGPKTEKAIKEFQLASGLSTDGIVGPNTWAVLFTE